MTDHAKRRGAGVTVSSDRTVLRITPSAIVDARTASIRQDIIERTGTPLFVEEMTKAVLEAGSEGAACGLLLPLPNPQSVFQQAFRLR